METLLSRPHCPCVKPAQIIFPRIAHFLVSRSLLDDSPFPFLFSFFNLDTATLSFFFGCKLNLWSVNPTPAHGGRLHDMVLDVGHVRRNCHHGKLESWPPKMPWHGSMSPALPRHRILTRGGFFPTSDDPLVLDERLRRRLMCNYFMSPN